MHKYGALILCGILLLSCETDPKAPGTTTGGSDTDGFIANYQSVSLADTIPLSVLDSVRGLDVYFEHASVGSNISAGIDSLATSNASRYAIGRESWGSGSIENNIISWYQQNSGFGDNSRGNPGFSEKVDLFDNSIRTAGFADELDVASYKMCYIDNNIEDSEAAFEYARDSMESLEEDFPDITFIWWTMPICTDGDEVRDAYNNLVRQYCSENDKYLIDIADIECHDPQGNRLTDSNGYELLYSDYTDDGGHLDEDGAELLARAWWVTLAKITGWEN